MQERLLFSLLLTHSRCFPWINNLGKWSMFHTCPLASEDHLLLISSEWRLKEKNQGMSINSLSVWGPRYSKMIHVLMLNTQEFVKISNAFFLLASIFSSHLVSNWKQFEFPDISQRGLSLWNLSLLGCFATLGLWWVQENVWFCKLFNFLYCC